MDQVLHILVCDDNRTASGTVAGTVERLLRDEGVPNEISIYANPEKALEQCQRSSPELVFLDIDMPKLDGLALGKLLNEMTVPPEIIFVSGREDKVFQALQVRPFAFVRKDHFMKDIGDTISSFVRYWRAKSLDKRIMISNREGVMGVPVASITWIECTAAVQQIHVDTQPDPIPITSRMQKLEEKLKPEGFLRIQKGYLVNYRRIDRLLGDRVIMQDGTELPVSRLKKQEIRDEYLELCQQNGAMLF